MKSENPNWKNKSIAFVSNRDSFIEGESCYYDGPNGRLIDLLIKRHPSLTLITYKDKIKKIWYNNLIQPKKLIYFPFTNNFSNGLTKSFIVTKQLKKLEKENDLLIIQLPIKSFIAPLFIKKPVIYHICSNLRTAATNPIKYKGIKRLFSKTYAEIFHWFHLQYFKKKNSILIANGSELGNLYRYNTKTVISSSIYSNEIIANEAIKKKEAIFKILFVGRPSLEKGFDTLLESINILIKAKSDFRLVCVGFTHKQFEETWKTKLDENLLKFIEFKGEIPFSQELFNIYRQADVLVLPSRSEGTPRVLVEARAKGCPIIASNIGGIPDSINPNVDGILFECGDYYALSQQILLLMNDESFRNSLQINGLNAVRLRMTLEKFCDVFDESISELFN